MDIKKQNLYNDSIEARQLIQETDSIKTDSAKTNSAKADSMAGFCHTIHTNSYRSHTVSSYPGQANIEYSDEIIEFNEY